MLEAYLRVTFYFFRQFNPEGSVHLSSQRTLDMQVVDAGLKAAGFPIVLPGIGRRVILIATVPGILGHDRVGAREVVTVSCDDNGWLGGWTRKHISRIGDILPLKGNDPADFISLVRVIGMQQAIETIFHPDGDDFRCREIILRLRRTHGKSGNP